MEIKDSKVYINYKEPVIILNKSKHIRSIKRNMPYNIRGMIEDIVILVDNNSILVSDDGTPIKSITELCSNLNITDRVWSKFIKYNKQYNIIKKYKTEYGWRLVLNPYFGISNNFEFNKTVYELFKDYFIENIRIFYKFIKNEYQYNIIKKDIKEENNIEMKKLKFKLCSSSEYEIFNEDYNGNGIYLLYKYDTIIYIGKSKNVKLRIKQHRKDKDFDCVKSIVFRDNNLVNLYEPYLIQKYQPKYNNDLLDKFEFELPEIKL